MKQEDLSLNYYDTLEDLRRDLDECVEYFNNMRHTSDSECKTERIFADRRKKIKWYFGLSCKKFPEYPYSITIGRETYGFLPAFSSRRHFASTRCRTKFISEVAIGNLRDIVIVRLLHKSFHKKESNPRGKLLSRYSSKRK